MNGNGIDIGLAIADAEGTSINVDAGVTTNLAADMAEVHFLLLQVTLHNTVGAHVHVKVKPRHRFLQSLNVDPALVILPLDFISGLTEVLKEWLHTHRRVQVSIIVLVLDHDTRLPRCAVQHGMGIVSH